MKFKKIASVIGSMLLIGASMGVAMANTYPTPFVQNGNADVAIVYGTGSAPSDLVAAGKIGDNLKSVFDSFNEDNKVSTGNFSSSVGITEEEVILGSKLFDFGNGKMRNVFTDNQIPSLIDDKIHWDDGKSTKTSFNVHEEILVGNMNLLTTLDNNDLKGVALTNDKDLEYRYVFEDELNISRIGNEDADDLTINILGKEYLVEEFGDNSITISSSGESVLKTGESIILEGITLTVRDIFEEAVQINGVFIKEGQLKNVDGLKVRVESIAYHSSDTLPSKVILKVGKEISTTYSDEDAYIGEDDSDPNWVWKISNPGVNGGSIGVKYEQRQLDSDDEIVYVGESYTFPENYATVQLESLTDVDYEDFEVSFDSSKDLYFAVDNNTKMYEDAKVVVLKGKLDDSFLINGTETDEIYLRYNNVSTSTIVEDEENVIIPYSNNTMELTKFECDNSGGIFYEGDSICEYLEVLGTKVVTSLSEVVDVFYNDVNKDYSDSIKPRFAFTINGTGDIGKLIYEDTKLDIKIDNRTLSIGDLSVELNPTGNFTHLGMVSEEAENNEITLNHKSVGNKEEDILGYDGLILYDSEANSEDDEVIFGVPSERVYATVSVLGQGEMASGTVPQLGAILVTDDEVANVATKNLIVVGGSCINSVAAKLIGVPVNTCGAEWTAKTNVGAGQYLLKEFVSPYNSGKVALLIAGYEAAETTLGVNSLIA